MTAQAAFDGSVKINSGPYQNGSGGEFGAVSVSGSLGNFETFCLEQNEHISFGNTYDYRINTGAVQGGVGAAATDPNTGLTMDNLSVGTAWLYSQFRAGTLANYFTANRNANAGVLQNAIWGLEGEVAYNAGNVYIAAAKAALSLTDAQVQADATAGLYNVVALNLFNGAGYTTVHNPQGLPFNVNQDVLGVVPEPTTVIAGALLLLPFAASTLRKVRRNS